MKQHLLSSFALLSIALLTSCSSQLKPLTSDYFIVTPTPLEAIGKQVPTTINGRFPEKYMKKKAVVTITPELRFADGKVVGQAATFQGEKIVGNEQTISYKTGGGYIMRTNFPYRPEMDKSELYLTFDARVGKKSVKIPAVKIADGVLSTEQLVYTTVASANTATAADKYQQSITQQQDAQIKYLINQAKIRTSELNTTSVKDFVKVLQEIKSDYKGYALDNVQVSAYASPDGTLRLNTALAESRQNSAAKYVSQQLNNNNLSTPIDVKYTAEDWEGFQELVAQSNIQDKELIIRVLSMYKDPEEREQQIKNLSLAFQDLANEILPELRRARLTINYRVIGRTDSEILQQYIDEPGRLSAEELLYAASITPDLNRRKEIFTTATQVYPTDKRAYNGLAQVAIAQGDILAAKTALAQAEGLVEAYANGALIALREGNVEQAENLIGKALTAHNYNEVLGNIQIARGNYAQAAQNLAGTKTNSAALAQILNKDYNAARATLDALPNPDANTAYLSAIVAARANQIELTLSALRKAIDLNPMLAQKAAKDLEFQKLFGNPAFRSLVK